MNTLFCNYNNNLSSLTFVFKTLLVIILSFSMMEMVSAGQTSISGSTLVIATPEENSNTGSVSVYHQGEDGYWIQDARLVAGDSHEQHYFGSSVDIFDNTLIVGAMLDGADGTTSGSAYIFVRSENGVWTQQAKIVAEDGGSPHLFGGAVSIFENTAVIGARWYHEGAFNEIGAAYIFVRDESGNWTQQSKLLAADGARSDSFGSSVAISEQTVVISSSRSAYVFASDGNGNWTQQEKLVTHTGSANDGFGRSISIYGDTIVIGAYRDDTLADNSGSAYVFIRDVNGKWNQQAKLFVDDNNSENYQFGRTVSITEESIVILGGPIPSGSSSHYYIFVYDENGGWDQKAKILSASQSGLIPSVTIYQKTLIRGSYSLDDNTSASCKKGLELDGNNDWINIPDFTLTNDFTIEGWFKLAPGIDYKDAIFGQEGSGPDIHFSAGRVRLYAYGIRVTAKTPLIADTWGHIAITRSGSNLTVYVNGIKDSTGRWNGQLSIKAIGRGNRGFAKGMLDEIRIWEVARTEAEINNSYDTSVDPNSAGLIGYWNFNETDQIISDASNARNHGSLGANTEVGTDDPVRLDSTALLNESCGNTNENYQAPIASNDTVGPIEAGSTINFVVTDNDTDNDGDLNLTSVSIKSVPSNGNATVNADGTITYVNTDTLATTDTLTYTVADLAGLVSNIATVSISITKPNVPPVATDDTTEPVEIGGLLNFTVTDNDEDSDGNLNLASVVIVSDPSHGTATVNASGTITYLHTGNTTTTDTLSYTVSDTDGAISNVATVTIFVMGGNASPIANNDIAGPVVAGEAITFSVIANDIASNGNLDPASISIVSTPIDGSATINSDGTITYVNTGTATTTDTLSYTVADVNGIISNEAIVSIQVIKPNLAPITTSDLVGAVKAGGTLSFTVTDNDVDVDGNLDPTSVVLVSGPYFGTATVDPSGIINYIHSGTTSPNFDQLTYTVADTEGAISRETTISIVVLESAFANETVNKILAKNGAENDSFGSSLSISGDTAVVTAEGYSSFNGSAYVFVRDGRGGWFQQAKLIIDDGIKENGFGRSASISGDTIIVGAIADDENGIHSGSAYIFVRDDNGNWSQQAKLLAEDGSANHLFGNSVSILENTAVIGAMWDNQGIDGVALGSAYIFIRDENGTWSQQTKLIAEDNLAQYSFGISISISENTVLIGTNSDAAYVFSPNETGEWTQQAKLTADDSSANSSFGRSVSISGDTIVTGDTEDNENGSRSGSAYVFIRDFNGVWNRQTKLMPLDGNANDLFGSSVSISEDTMIISAQYDDDHAESSGSAYVFVRDNNGNWNQHAKLLAFDASAHDRLGNSVSISGNTVVVGVKAGDDYGNNSGSAYIFDLEDTTTSCGKAIELDGINDWVNIPDLTLANDFTIEGWFKLAPGIDYKDAIFGQEGSGPDIHFSAGRVRLYAYGIRVTAKTPLIADTWGHIAITRSGSNLTVYINGVKDSTGRWNGLLKIKAIGRGNRGFTKGMMDEIRIWEVARTESEISNSYDTSVDSNLAGLIGYWNFNNTDQIINDSSSQENHGSLGLSIAAGSDDPVRLDSTAPITESCN